MLVFQKTFVDHVSPKLQDRIGTSDIKWLIEAVEEINVHLPDDWRLTRSKNSFRIQVVAEYLPTFVGHCFRDKQGHVINVIDSVFAKEFYDVEDVNTYIKDRKIYINNEVKKQYPEIVVPNLYFFRPCPDNFYSPLFARQYEKIFVDESGKKANIQYHRIHPLTKSGLDLEHFLWIKFDVETGNVKTVEKIDNRFHGKDYWQAPSLESSRRSSMESYVLHYKDLLKEYGVLPSRPVERLPDNYEIEYKFMMPEGKLNVREFYNDLLKNIKKLHFAVVSKGESKKQEDTYFDDEIFSLHSGKCSLRIRKMSGGGGNTRLTFKKKFSEGEEHYDEGLYRRIEEETIITAGQKYRLFKGERINALPCRLVRYIAPSCGKLKPVVRLINNRLTMTVSVKDNPMSKADLSFDEIVYSIGGKEVGPYYEIELESKGMSEDTLKTLADFIETAGLIPSHQTKYERGVSLLRK